MPLTVFQAQIARLLSVNRTPDSYLAGGAALHIEPNSRRFSNDLDFFNDSVERVSDAFAEDSLLLERNRYSVDLKIKQPGYISALVHKGGATTKIAWAHDSAWRFLPTSHDERTGYQLHPIDLAINKVLALAGRDEPRDLIDTLHVHDEILTLGGLCWAGAGKDPGFTPLSLLALLRRRGKYQQADLNRLQLVVPISVQDLKIQWLAALESAECFIATRPMEEVGCLYYAKSQNRFVAPQPSDNPAEIIVHYGRPGGVLPQFQQS